MRKVTKAELEKRQKFVERFVELVESNGDSFFSLRDINEDYEMITQIIKGQGYWAGEAFRYFYDEKEDKFKYEERRFG